MGWAIAATCGFSRASITRRGDLLARLLLAVVDAGHDPIGLGQHVVGQVEPAAFEDIDLDALQHGDAARAAR